MVMHNCSFSNCFDFKTTVKCCDLIMIKFRWRLLCCDHSLCVCFVSMSRRLSYVDACVQHWYLYLLLTVRISKCCDFEKKKFYWCFFLFYNHYRIATGRQISHVVSCFFMSCNKKFHVLLHFHVLQVGPSFLLTTGKQVGFQIPSKLVWPNSWIAQIVK